VVNTLGIFVAIAICGIIIYYNWKAYRRDGQRPYEPTKLPFRRGEFKSDREPEETFDWFSITRDRDTIGIPWAQEYPEDISQEELDKLSPEFKDFYYLCRRLPALFLTLKQIAEVRGSNILDIIRMFDEEQRAFLTEKALVSRKLMNELNAEMYRSTDGTIFHDFALGGKVTWPKFSERFQELRKIKADIDNEVVEYVERIFK
jgi:hypothetical protein